MNNKSRKGWESFVIKVMVISMSICYVFGPSHNEIDKMLHFIVHQLDQPESLLTHSNLDDKHHVDHNLKVNNKEHQHTVLDTLSKILKVCGLDDEPDNEKIVLRKIDKHLRTKKIYNNRDLFFESHIKDKFLFLNKNIHQGFLKSKLQPPQFT